MERDSGAITSAADPRDQDARDGDEAMSDGPWETSGNNTIDALQNPTDAAIDRHIWPDGDWNHETCRCGAPHPCDAGILARSTSTALEQLDFHNRRANAAIERLTATEARQRENDRMGLVALIEGAELRRRLEMAEKVIAVAVADLDDEYSVFWREYDDEVIDTCVMSEMIRAVRDYEALTRPMPDQEGE
jgi:hypothetical protein